MRDFVIRALMLLPLRTRLWLQAQCTRPLLWLLFHLETESVTVAPVGPGFFRYHCVGWLAVRHEYGSWDL